MKKAEHRRIDAFELWCWRRLLRVLWTARRFNKSILKEISPEYPLAGVMLKLKLQYIGHLMPRADSFEKTLILGKIEGRRGRGQQRMIWLIQFTSDLPSPSPATTGPLIHPKPLTPVFQANLLTIPNTLSPLCPRSSVSPSNDTCPLLLSRLCSEVPPSGSLPGSTPVPVKNPITSSGLSDVSVPNPQGVHWHYLHGWSPQKGLQCLLKQTRMQSVSQPPVDTLTGQPHSHHLCL